MDELQCNGSNCLCKILFILFSNNSDHDGDKKIQRREELGDAELRQSGRWLRQVARELHRLWDHSSLSPSQWPLQTCRMLPLLSSHRPPSDIHTHIANNSIGLNCHGMPVLVLKKFHNFVSSSITILCISFKNGFTFKRLHPHTSCLISLNSTDNNTIRNYWTEHNQKPNGHMG